MTKTVAKKAKAQKTKSGSKTKPVAKKAAKSAKPSAASTSKKAARKKAAKLKAIEAARVAEETAAATLHYAPAPFEAVAEHDPSKAPGKQHRHPPVNFVDPKHSPVVIPRMRANFNRRMNIGR